MARIRTVKPELAAHEGLFDLEIETGLPIRFAWCMLFTVADREGRFLWRPRAIKASVLPFDELNFSDVLGALERAGFIVRYEADGDIYGHIPSWSKHQAVNVREAASRIPAPPPHTKQVHARACTGIEQATHIHVPRGVNVPAELRETVYARDGRVCKRCGAVSDLTIDHIFPQCIGGTHALTNLRTLCRSCNSARPVNGEELIADLARDALTLNDMQRMCEHVHAHGERKGKEGKGREGEGEAKTLPPRDASEIERAEFVATIKTDYPPPQGRVDWITAEKAACQAVLNQGATWQQLIDGVRRYRAYIAATGSYVMNPAKFFAAVDRPWFQPWTIPPPRAAGGAPYRRAKTPDELEAEEAARNAQ